MVGWLVCWVFFSKFPQRAEGCTSMLLSEHLFFWYSKTTFFFSESTIFGPQQQCIINNWVGWSERGKGERGMEEREGLLSIVPLYLYQHHKTLFCIDYIHNYYIFLKFFILHLNLPKRPYKFEVFSWRRKRNFFCIFVFYLYPYPSSLISCGAIVKLHSPTPPPFPLIYTPPLPLLFSSPPPTYSLYPS